MKALLALAFALLAGTANAQTYPYSLNQQSLDQQASAEAVSSFLFSSPLKTMAWLTARATAAGFVYVFDAPTLPGNGAVVACTSAATVRPCYVLCVPLAANGVTTIAWQSPVKFTTGVLGAYSSTGCASITASATAQFFGQTP